MAKRVTKENAFGRSLPKWPQFKISGEPVTVEQAKDIIYRTDQFMRSYSYGGNNHYWNDWVDHMFGREDLKESYSRFGYELFDEVDRQNRHVGTEYMTNDWMSSCYAHGPHGWCSPDGTIAYIDNIGKWPSVREVHGELKLLSKEFPYLKLTGTLINTDGKWDDEGNETEASDIPIITFVVKNSKVMMTDEHELYHYPVQFPDRINFPSWDGSHGREQGVPNSWIFEFEEPYSQAIERAKAAILKRRG